MSDVDDKFRGPRLAADMTEVDYAKAVLFCADRGGVSKGLIQRQLGIGFNAASTLVEWMEQRRFCTTANHIGKREILQP